VHFRTDVDAVVDEIAQKEVLITQNKLAQVRNLVISILTVFNTAIGLVIDINMFMICFGLCL